MRDTVELTRRLEREEHGDACHCLILTFCNYFEKRAVIEADNYFQVHHYANRCLTIDY